MSPNARQNDERPYIENTVNRVGMQPTHRQKHRRA